MLPIKIDDKPYVIPTSWKDVSVKMYRDLCLVWEGWKERGTYDLVEMYAVLIGCDYKVISGANQGDFARVIEPNISFINKKIDLDKIKLPKVVSIKGKQIPVKGLDMETIGQKMTAIAHIDRIVKMEASDAVKAHDQMLSLCSIYFYRQITGSPVFDAEEAVKQRKWIESASVTEMYPVTRFFFQSLTGSQSTKRRFLTSLLKMTRKQPGRISLIGTRSRQSTASQEVI